MTETFTAFEGQRRLVSGPLAEVALAIKHAERHAMEPIAIFSDATGRAIDLDLHGGPDEVLARLPETVAASPRSEAMPGEPRGRGRPRFGVVAREVTLLPRHWEWLNSQPGGASVALRKLVEEARRVYAGKDRLRQSQEASYRFMSALAGNLPGFEEATRALFAGNQERFDDLVEPWPEDVRNHARK